jgi:flagellar biosynthesis/type III secretory pathway M-ring protein FliF/YscJ
MISDALSWFHSVNGHGFWLGVVIVAIVLLWWLAVELRDRRDDRRAEAADEEWAAKQVERNKLPTALSIPDVVQVKQEPVDEIVEAIRKRRLHDERVAASVLAKPERTNTPKRVKRPNKRARHK